MSTHPLLISLLAFALLYGAGLLALVVAGRREDARALATLIPDCMVFVRRLLADERVPRRSKWLLGLLGAYLALPIDLVPDFIPVAGQLDDAILVAWTLRRVLRSSGRELLDEHWPGPDRSRALIARLATGGTECLHRG